MAMITRFIKKLYLSILRKRNAVLFAKKIGVRIGSDCKIVSVTGGTFGRQPYLVKIGNHVEISGNVHFITHDGGAWVFRREYPTLDVFSPIIIGNNVFIGYGSILLPGTRVEDNCVIGAGSVVRGTLSANGVYAGTPVKKVKALEKYKIQLLERSADTKGLTDREKYRILCQKFHVK